MRYWLFVLMAPGPIIIARLVLGYDVTDWESWVLIAGAWWATICGMEAQRSEPHA